MVRLLGLVSVVLVIAPLLGFAPAADPAGASVPDSEAALVMGACYRIGTSSTSYLCYGFTCSSGCCGCTSDVVFTTPNGFELNTATPCATSWNCTAVHSTSNNACL